MKQKLFQLMHKDIVVCELIVDSLLGGIVSVPQIYEPEHLPPGTPLFSERSEEIVSSLRLWWQHRAIPLDRFASLSVLNITNYDEFLISSLGLSLSDCYWIRPRGTDNISWADINFYDNTFPEYIGEGMMYGSKQSDISFSGGKDSYSPDSMLNGVLKKRWIISPDQKRILIKTSTPPYYQQAFNEEIASGIADILGFNHVSYTLCTDGKDPQKVPASACGCFTSQNLEFVPASSLMSLVSSETGLSPYEKFLSSCRRLRVRNFSNVILDRLDEMIALDYIIVNTDRHWNNFGLLRDPDTLEYSGLAPLFDCGTSLLFNQQEKMFDQACCEPCRPFCDTFDKQIKLISSPERIDLSGLTDEIIEKICRKAFEKFDGTKYEISNLRSDVIVRLVRERTDCLQKHL